MTELHDYGTEAALIGALISHPEAIWQCADIVLPEFFYNELTQATYSSLLYFAHASLRPDFSVLAVKVHQLLDMELLTCKKMLGEITAAASIPSMIPSMVEALTELYKRRKLLELGMWAQKQMSASSRLNTEEAISVIFAKLQNLASVGMNRNSSTIYSTAKAVIESITKRKESNVSIIGLATGFRGLDDYIGGCVAGELVVLQARPAMGKSALAGQLAFNIAASGHHGAFFSGEMTSIALVNRLLASESGIEHEAIHKANLTDRELTELTEHVKCLKQVPLEIIESAGITVEEIAVRCRQMKAQKQLRYIVVDHLQLLRTKSNHRDSTRANELAEVTSCLKQLSQSLGITVIALCQLNRLVQGRQDKRPLLSDSRDSGSIEQDADVVLGLYRHGYYNADADQYAAELIVLKNRNGNIGTIHMLWDGSKMRFSDRAQLRAVGNG